MMTDEIPIKPVITFDELRMKVEKYVQGDEMSYTEAIVDICKDKEIDPEDIAKIIRGPLKDKLEAEAMERNIIKRTTAYLL
tara:strand:+ start:2341 stop:2583 length:243 start_codon:yes stop_codon:yes gene_type:complete